MHARKVGVGQTRQGPTRVLVEDVTNGELGLHRMGIVPMVIAHLVELLEGFGVHAAVHVLQSKLVLFRHVHADAWRLAYTMS